MLACSSEVATRIVALTRTDAALTMREMLGVAMLSSVARRSRKPSLSKVETSPSTR